MGERKLRVLHVIDSIDSSTGGPIQSIIQLAAHQMHDIETSLVTLDLHAEGIDGDFPLPARYLGVDDIFRRTTGAFRLTPTMVPWLRQHASSYDIVVLHSIWTFAPLGAWLALRRAGVPYVAFTHGMLDPWFKRTYPLKHAKKQLFWSLFLGRLLNEAAGVIFTAEEERLMARGSFCGFQQYRENIISLGVEKDRNDRDVCMRAFHNKLPKLGGRKFILFLGRIHPKKGCDILIEAFSRFSVENDEFDLVVAGPDPLGLRPVLEDIARKHGRHSRIHWPGMVTGPAKWGAFYATEAFILPSHQENFGIAVAEALSCAVPVLISNKINIWREIDRSGAGVVADDTLHGTLSLFHRFTALQENEKRQMADNAERCQAQYFDARVNANQFTSLLTEVVARKHNERRRAPDGLGIK
jgi:glycosyltransferase involved in cell wall biosynthesis